MAEQCQGSNQRLHTLSQKIIYRRLVSVNPVRRIWHLESLLQNQDTERHMTLKKYAKMPRVAYIECDDTMACRDLVEAIEIQIGMPKGSGGTIWSRVNRIRDFFNANEGYLLIIDEADKLINKYTQKKMEIIRGIFDQSDVGIVIAGEPRLEAEIKGNLARFANRMDFYYKLKGLSPQEVKDYMEGYDVDDAAMMEFISRATNAQTGCFRLLDRTLNNVIRILKENGQTQITMKIVNQASNMMML